MKWVDWNWWYHSCLALQYTRAMRCSTSGPHASDGELCALFRPVVKREEAGHLPHSIGSLLYSLSPRPTRVIVSACIDGLSLVWAELKGWPFVKKSIGTFYYLTYLLQLWWVSLWGCICTWWDTHMAFQLFNPARCTLLTYWGLCWKLFLYGLEVDAHFNKRTSVPSEIHYKNWRQLLDS